MNSYLVELIEYPLMLIHSFEVVFKLNLLDLEGINDPKCLVKDLGRFGGFRDEKQVKNFVKCTWARPAALHLQCTKSGP